MAATRRTILAQAAALPAFAVAAPAGNLIVRHDRLFLDVKVNGRPVRALVDSAAEASFVDTAFARRIGVVGAQTVRARGSGGDTQAQLAEGVTIDALGFHLHPEAVAVLDLSDVGSRLLHSPLDFVLGRELFDAGRIEVDIAGGRMRRLSAGVRPAGVELDLTTERGLETFPASIEGHDDVATAFDLGNGGAVLVGGDYAREIGLLADGRPVTMESGGGIGGAKPRQTFRLRSLKVAGRIFTDLPAAVDANSSATPLNIGVAVLGRFRIVTDFPAHRLWLQSLTG